MTDDDCDCHQCQPARPGPGQPHDQLRLGLRQPASPPPFEEHSMPIIEFIAAAPPEITRNVPTFDQWYAAKHGGRSFDGDHMQPHHTPTAALRAMMRLQRDYISEMVQLLATPAVIAPFDLDPSIFNPMCGMMPGGIYPCDGGVHDKYPPPGPPVPANYARTLDGRIVGVAAEDQWPHPTDPRLPGAMPPGPTDV